MNLLKAIEREAMRTESKLRLETFRKDRKDDAITTRAAKTLLAEPEPIVEPAPEVPAAPVIVEGESWTVAGEGEIILQSEHVLLTGDFSSVCKTHFDAKYGPSNINTVANHWRRRRRAQLGLPPETDIAELAFRATVNTYGADGRELDSVDFTLNPDFTVPRGTQVLRGALGEIGIYEDGTEALRLYFHFTEANALDLLAAKAATAEEAHALLNPPPPVEEPYVPPVYKKIPREAGDAASRLGFSLGSDADDIKMPALPAVWKAFHLPSAIIVGRVDVSLDGGAIVDIFAPQGERVLRTWSGSQFDQIKLGPGDYLAILTRCSGHIGKGVLDPEQAGLFPEGAKPLLDELLENPPAVPMNFEWPQKPIQMAMPRIRFSA